VEITSGELFFLVLGSMVAHASIRVGWAIFCKVFYRTSRMNGGQGGRSIVGGIFSRSGFVSGWFGAMLPLNNIIEAQLALLWTMSPLLESAIYSGPG